MSKLLTWSTNKIILTNSLGLERQRFLAKFFLAILVTTHTLIVLWPILGSAFSADDTFDSMVPMQLQYSGQSNWSFINGYTSNWSRTEGRFFPIAVIIGFYSHFFFLLFSIFFCRVFFIIVSVVAGHGLLIQQL